MFWNSENNQCVLPLSCGIGMKGIKKLTCDIILNYFLFKKFKIYIIKHAVKVIFMQLMNPFFKESVKQRARI